MTAGIQSIQGPNRRAVTRPNDAGDSSSLMQARRYTIGVHARSLVPLERFCSSGERKNERVIY